MTEMQIMLVFETQLFSSNWLIMLFHLERKVKWVTEMQMMLLFETKLFSNNWLILFHLANNT